MSSLERRDGWSRPAPLAASTNDCALLIPSYDMGAHFAARHPEATMSPQLAGLVAMQPHEREDTTQLLTTKKVRATVCEDPNCAKCGRGAGGGRGGGWLWRWPWPRRHPRPRPGCGNVTRRVS